MSARSDQAIRWFTAIVALLILGATFYALVLYPFVLDSDVKLWLTGLSGTAALYLFGDQLQRSSARQAQDAYEKGLAMPAPTSGSTTPGSDMPAPTWTPNE